MTGAEPMHPQLTLLLEIQDLRTQERTLRTETGIEEVEQEHFQIDVGDAVSELEETIGELEDQLDAGIRSRYDRVARSLDRVVVPVINGVCYGCFVSIPAATAGEQDPNEEIRTCQHCGRFIYILS